MSLLDLIPFSIKTREIKICKKIIYILSAFPYKCYCMNVSFVNLYKLLVIINVNIKCSFVPIGGALMQTRDTRIVFSHGLL